MNNTHLATARLLCHVAPVVMADNVFALKGGTAINLFLRGQLIAHKSSILMCRGRGSNPHAPCGTRDFKSRASASFATPACRSGNWTCKLYRSGAVGRLETGDAGLVGSEDPTLRTEDPKLRTADPTLRAEDATLRANATTRHRNVMLRHTRQRTHDNVRTTTASEQRVPAARPSSASGHSVRAPCARSASEQRVRIDIRPRVAHEVRLQRGYHD